MQKNINVMEGLEYEFLCSHDQDGVYQFRISAFNSAGEGNKSDAIIGKFVAFGVKLYIHHLLYRTLLQIL